MKLSNVLILFLLVFCFKGSYADDLPDKPNPPRLVNDYIDLLNPQERNNLESKLVAFDKETSTQIAIIITGDLKGYAISDYAISIGEKWGVGREGKDNGIVIVVKPTGGKGQRKTFIAVGYGLEGAIPDAIQKRIVDKEMIPEFKNLQYYKGLDKATDILMGLASEEFTAGEYVEKTKVNYTGPIVTIILFLLIVIFSRVSRTRSYASTNHIPFWTAFWIMGSGSHGGTFGNFSSGSGGFGGFGGFGGGSFGGGGAGGSW